VSSTPVYITDMGAASPAGGVRIGDALVLHDGLTLEQQGELLAELLREGERPAFFHLTVAPSAVRQSA
jgi:hypothetical protein